MAAAVSVLMFLIAGAFLVNSLSERGRDWLSNLACAVCVTLGVMNVASGIQAFHIATGVVLSICGVVSILLFGKVCKETGGGGPGVGLGILLMIGSFLLMAWVITFAVLQFVLVA